MNRRDLLQYAKTMGIWSMASWQTARFGHDEYDNSKSPRIHKATTPQGVLTRKIPSANEHLPVVGLGTWQTFDVSNDSEKEPLRDVLKTLVENGGKVVDSSPMYGRSEEVVGELSTEVGVNNKLFIATKVWTNGKENGIRQMNDSFRLLRREKIDLMQIHNLTDWETHLKTLREWKEKGKIKYIGLTHYTDGAHERLGNIIEKENVDFIQVNYNLLDRHAEKKLLPLAQDKNVAVLINQPFESGSLFQKVKGKGLPAWAKEFDCNSWGQFFLKFILSNPAVTCVIPGTSKPHHMLDNVGAASGRLPNQSQRADMVKLFA
jgi:diketogulonate reductase-like aldo/keto reductase